jgi:polysaccharide biosynthesis/export protein
MRDLNRSGKTGRCALALYFGLAAAICFGQEVPAQQAASAKEAAGNPPAPAAGPAKPAEVPAAEPKPAQPIVRVTSPETKGKPSSKKGKNPVDNSGGSPVFVGIEDKPYEIGPEDVLFINVLHQPDVTGQVTVRPDGFISVRFANEIKAAGLTTEKLADEVAEKLTKYFNHPEVNIQVVRILSKKYYMSGEIRRPGSYSLSTPKTVLEAIIDAGGPADFAKKKAIYILRGKQKIPFNFADVSKGKNLGQNIILQNGDVVVVP